MSLIIAISFVSCNKNDNGTPYAPNIKPATGLYVLNEGNFTYANSSLSYYDIKADTIANNVFYRVNGSPIGDVARSLTKIGDDLYIVVNNSKYIYKVDAQTILYKAKIAGFTSPRYMLPVSDSKAYVTDIVSPGFWSMDLATYEKHLVSTGKTTECMVKVGNEVFMSNWSKSYVDFENNTVQVIDCDSDELIAEIEVAKEPKAMVLDKHNKIWVICNGGWDPSETQEPALICIDPATRQVVKRFDFTPGADSPDGLAIDGAGENIFFMNGTFGGLNLYKMSVDATQLPDSAYIASAGRSFYGLTVDPVRGDIYLTDTKNYVQNGDLLRYSSDGTMLSTHELGIIPSYMLFN